jgi:hypothetical protein
MSSQHSVPKEDTAEGTYPPSAGHQDRVYTTEGLITNPEEEWLSRRRHHTAQRTVPFWGCCEVETSVPRVHLGRPSSYPGTSSSDSTGNGSCIISLGSPLSSFGISSIQLPAAFKSPHFSSLTKPFIDLSETQASIASHLRYYLSSVSRVLRERKISQDRHFSECKPSPRGLSRHLRHFGGLLCL